MSNLHWVAILGRGDALTDALRDYCGRLGEALLKRSAQLETAEASWALDGWPRALRRLWKASRAWRNHWVLAQYTALAWSWRGFPVGFLAVQGILRLRKARRAVVYHDASAYGGRRMVDRIRGACQNWVMRTSCRWADRSVLTLALDKASWLPPDRRNVAFIPVGANIPEALAPDAAQGKSCNQKTVAIFGVTGGELIACRELPLKMLVVGRDERALYQAAIQRLGLQERIRFEAPSADVVQFYAAADAYVDPSLHDAFALPAAEAMACGLPVATSQNAGVSEMISNGVDGLILEEPTDAERLARLIQQLCNDPELRRRLGENAIQTSQKYTWARNANRSKRFLNRWSHGRSKIWHSRARAK